MMRTIYEVQREDGGSCQMLLNLAWCLRLKAKVLNFKYFLKIVKEPG